MGSECFNDEIGSFLEEDLLYEVLLLSAGADGVVHIRPVGMRLDGEDVAVTLYPSRTLSNIRDVPRFSVLFTDDPLLFTRTLLDDLFYDECVLDEFYLRVDCEVSSFVEHDVENQYGKNISTKIIAKVIKIHKNKFTLPSINRATNHIIELLVDYSRFDLLDVYWKNNFYKKLSDSEKIINKTGNRKHKQALKIIKEKVGEK